MIAIILELLDDHQILPESTDIAPGIKRLEILEKSISNTDIMEVYFMHFRNLFFLIRIVWRKSKDDIGFLEEVDIALYCTTIESYMLADIMQ